MKPSTRLIRLIRPPSHVANSLDWSKTTKNVATLHIGRENIGVAIGCHPQLDKEIRHFDEVPLQLRTISHQNQRTLTSDCVRQLEHACKDYNVGSFVVLWPVQPEGRAGASCGKVLHTLESLIVESHTVLTKNRPLCLWAHSMTTVTNTEQRHQLYAEDEWGRCAQYGRPCFTKQLHVASREQYNIPKGSSRAAVDAWEDFCRAFWPLLYDQNDVEDSQEELILGYGAKVRRAASRVLHKASNSATATTAISLSLASQRRALSMQMT